MTFSTNSASDTLTRQPLIAVRLKGQQTMVERDRNKLSELPLPALSAKPTQS